MGEIAEIVGGGTPRTNDPSNYEDGTIPWVTPADLSGYTAKKIGHGSRFITEKGLSTSSARLMPAGTVLFTSRAPIGYVAISSNPIATNQGFKSFLLSEGISPDYVYWHLKGSKELAESLASGTTFLELSGAKAKQIPIPLAPLEQQKLIVAEIEKQFSRLDEAVAGLKRIKTNLKRYKAAVLKAAVEGELTEEWREAHPTVETGAVLLKHILTERKNKWEEKNLGKKYKEPVAPDTSNLPELPERWVWTTVDQLTIDSLIGLDRGRNQQNSEGIGVPYVKMNNVTMEGEVTTEDMVYVNASAEEKHHFSLERDDLLFNTRNSKELVGKVGLVRAIPKDAIYNNNLMRIRFVEGATPGFVCIQMCSDGFRRRMELVKKATTNVAAVYAKDLFPLQLALPPLQEQQRILAEVDRLFSFVREVKAQVDTNLQRAECLRQSILVKAFSGRLVAHNPEDEPAHIIIERINTERNQKRLKAQFSKKARLGNSIKGDDIAMVKKMPAQQRPLIEVLRDAKRPLKPEDLFAKSGYSAEEVEEFYAELKKIEQAYKLIQEKKGNGEVYLRIKL